MSSLRCSSKCSHLMALTSSSTRPGQAGTGLSWNSRIRPSCHRRIPADQPEPAVSAQTAKSLQAVLLTDAQLVSDGHSSIVLNGARVKLKAGGAFMCKPSSWSSHFLLSVLPRVTKSNHLGNVLQIFLLLVIQTCLSGH